VNETFVISLLLVAALAFSLGYFLASVALSQSIRNDLADLDAERLELDAERHALHQAWNATPAAFSRSRRVEA
jgi:hypothetical protein